MHDRSEWVPDSQGSTLGILDGRESAPPDAGGGRGRRELLMCCCMSTFPPPGREFEHPELEPPAVYRSMKGDTKAFLANLTDMLAPRAQHWHAQHTGFLAQVVTRVHRYAVTEQLRANGLNCSHGVLKLPAAEALALRQRAGRKRVEEERVAVSRLYAERLFDARFVVSPQGKGRACHRDWEALAAGAVPVLDWDGSAAMAELYDGLPVVRVRDWTRVTPAYLEREWERLEREHAAGRIDMRKLYVPYWVAQLTAHMVAPPAAPSELPPELARLAATGPS